MRCVLNSPTRNSEHNKCIYLLSYYVLSILIIFLLLFYFFNRIVSVLGLVSIYSYTIQINPNSYIIVKTYFYDLYITMNPAKVPLGIFFVSLYIRH